MGKNAIDLDEKSFDDFIRKGVVVIDFWATWCGPCKIMGPIFEEAAGELKGKAKFGKVDVDANHEIAEKFEIRSIPTTMFFKDGEQVDMHVGVLDKKELVKVVKEIK